MEKGAWQLQSMGSQKTWTCLRVAWGMSQLGLRTPPSFRRQGAAPKQGSHETGVSVTFLGQRAILDNSCEPVAPRIQMAYCCTACVAPTDKTAPSCLPYKERNCQGHVLFTETHYTLAFSSPLNDMVREWRLSAFFLTILAL